MVEAEAGDEQILVCERGIGLDTCSVAKAGGETGLPGHLWRWLWALRLHGAS